MIFRPHPLSNAKLDPAELEQDRKNCRKVGPCGIGEKALYLNSFFIDRHYYVPIKTVTRAFKRIAMSKGGFSGKGSFASIPYLVIEFDNGRQKQCNFKHEQQVDEFLTLLSKEQLQIKLVSQTAEAKLARQEAEEEKERLSRTEPTAQTKKETGSLQRAIDYLELKPEFSENLSKAAQRRRAYQCSSPSYRWVAMAITILGFLAVAAGIYSFTIHNGFAVYFVLFGIAAIFTFAGFSMLPTAKNNRKSILNYDETSQQQMEQYIREYPDFPVPARYAHPIVLKRMQRVIEQGRASTAEQALEVVKKDLKALNSSVQVSQKEYDEVVAIKPMFLNAMYQ